MTGPFKIAGLAVTTMLCSAGLAAAQDTPADPAMQNAGADAAAVQVQTPRSACMTDLQALDDQMRSEGYWLSGWNNRGYGVGALPSGGMAPPPTTTTVNEATGAPGRGPAGQPVATGGIDSGPWGDVNWSGRPRFEIRSLYNAARVLASHGDEQACATVAGAARDLYSRYSSELQGAGLSGDDVTGWRREQLVASQPVSQIQGAISVDDIIGSDIRNIQDDDLGEIEDVVLDPQTGNVRYVLISRGGFLGLGGDRIAVPWGDLRATPGLNTFVLPVSSDDIANAPSVNGDIEETGSLRRADRYWDNAVKDVGSAANNVGNALRDIGDNVGNAVRDLGNNVGNAVNDIGNDLQTDDDVVR